MKKIKMIKADLLNEVILKTGVRYSLHVSIVNIAATLPIPYNYSDHFCMS